MKQSREPKSVSVCSIRPSAASWGAATANSLTMPNEPRPVVATAVDGPGFGAGAIVGTRTQPARKNLSLAQDQEADAAAGSAACHKTVVERS